MSHAQTLLLPETHRCTNRDLRAVFKLPYERLVYFRDSHDHANGVRTGLLVIPFRNDQGRVCENISFVQGDPQDVMFLIGHVAANGEDCLIRVEAASF